MTLALINGAAMASLLADRDYPLALVAFGGMVVNLGLMWMSGRG